MGINNKTAKEHKDGQVSRIIKLTSDLNKKEVNKPYLQKINCAARQLMLEDLEAEMQFKADFKSQNHVL